MRPNEIRNLNADEVKVEVAKRRAELLELRFQTRIGQATNPKRIREARREIARLLTIASEPKKEQA
jgi:large subunit ribosomal protein L29